MAYLVQRESESRGAEEAKMAEMRNIHCILVFKTVQMSYKNFTAQMP